MELIDASDKIPHAGTWMADVATSPWCSHRPLGTHHSTSHPPAPSTSLCLSTQPVIPKPHHASETPQNTDSQGPSWNDRSPRSKTVPGSLHFLQPPTLSDTASLEFTQGRYEETSFLWASWSQGPKPWPSLGLAVCAASTEWVVWRESTLRPEVQQHPSRICTPVGLPDTSILLRSPHASCHHPQMPLWLQVPSHDIILSLLQPRPLEIPTYHSPVWFWSRAWFVKVAVSCLSTSQRTAPSWLQRL